MTPAEAVRRLRMERLVLGRQDHAERVLTSLVAGHRITSALPLPADVLAQVRADHEWQLRECEEGRR